MSVPLFDTSKVLEPLREELRAAVARVLDSERYILGPEVQAFEQEFAAYCGTGHAVGVANGTEAITIALRAMGVGPGDEVLVPSFTFYASVEAIAPTGATPVFCDIDPQTFCINAETVAEALTPHTKAVIAVHLFGNLAPVAEIEALGVPVLEDAAQAAGSTTTHGHSGAPSHSSTHDHPDAQIHGAAHGRSGTRVRPGALGRAATFSFFPSKNLGCFGDGGMIRHSTTRTLPTCARAALSRLPRQGLLRAASATTRAWTSCKRRSCASNFHTSTTGRTGVVMLPRTTHEAGLGELVTLPRPTLGSIPAWHLYVVRHSEADRLAALSQRPASAAVPTTALPCTSSPRCGPGDKD